MGKGRWVSALVALGVLISFAAAACGDGGSSAPAPMATSPSAAGERLFAPAELAQFDGKDGRAAYVAVDGVVYDVSGSHDWPGGEHTPCDLDAMAGEDLSDEIAQAPPSMRRLMEQMPVVGRLEP